MRMESFILLATGIVSGATSVPLTYFAVRSHRDLRHLHHTNHQLRRLLSGHRMRTSTRPHGRPHRRADRTRHPRSVRR